MIRHLVRCGVCALALIGSSGFAHANAPAPKAPKKAGQVKQDPQLLSLEVAALQTVRHLELSAGQLQELIRLSKGTASAPKPPGQTSVPPAFMKTLTALRDALLSDDDVRIDELREKLDAIMDDDNIHVEDRMPISGPARRNAAQAVRLLKPSQVMIQLEVLEDDEIEPLEALLAALERGKGVGAAAWKTMRDEAAAEAAWLIAGSDEKKAGPIARQIATLLDEQRSAAAKNGKKSRQDLQRRVQQWTAALDPFDILRNAMEREMAELLSNPCLPQALQHVVEQNRRLAVK